MTQSHQVFTPQTTGTGPDSATLNPILEITAIGAIANMNTTGTTQDPSIDLPIAAPCM